jgi:LmbE family N-acetylglucosaminyl deacetylase
MSPHPERRDLTGRTSVFLHAHPDDEVILTAATMHRLAPRGNRVVLVTATAGEVGEPLIPVPRGTSLAELRTRELEPACTETGVARLVLLPFRDSGMVGTPPDDHPRAFARHAGRTVAHLANLLCDEAAETLVHYDSGVYGHPDHVAVHRPGRAAARARSRRLPAHGRPRHAAGSRPAPGGGNPAAPPRHSDRTQLREHQHGGPGRRRRTADRGRLTTRALGETRNPGAPGVR